MELQVDEAPPKLKEIFEEVCPYYLAKGMSLTEFWDEDPQLVKFYDKADEIKRRQKNHELWMQGMYIYDALVSVASSFGKGKTFEYPDMPYPLTASEKEEQEEIRRKRNRERAKASFAVWAENLKLEEGELENESND